MYFALFDNGQLRAHMSLSSRTETPHNLTITIHFVKHLQFFFVFYDSLNENQLTCLIIDI